MQHRKMKAVSLVTLVTLKNEGCNDCNTCNKGWFDKMSCNACNNCTTGWFEGRIWGLYKSVTLVTPVTLIYQAILSETL